jgi:diphthine-ammonia ligase
MPNVVISLSGGKDSMYALYTVLKEGLHVNYFLFIKTGSKAHLSNRWLLELISESLGIPAVTVGRSIPEIRRALQRLKTGTLVSGVMTTSEHIDYYQEICDPINVKHYAPLWGKDPFTALVEMRQLGFRMLVVGVDCSMASRKDWLGKELDDNMLSEIAKLEKEQKMNPIGEMGEYHTLVLDCPIYRKEIKILKSQIVWEGSKGYFVVKNAVLKEKTKQ